MASTQKKPAKGKPKTAARTKSAQSRPAAKKKKAVYLPNFLARGIGASVCLFLAALLFLGMFGIHALVVDLLCQTIKGLVGYGFWITPLVLLGVAYVLAFRRERSVRLRIWCMSLLPLAVGALLHVIFTGQTYAMHVSSVSALWSSGAYLGSGGVVAGGIAVVLSTLFSRIGAGLVILLALVILMVFAFHVTPEKVRYRVRRHRERREDRAAARSEREEAWREAHPVDERYEERRDERHEGRYDDRYMDRRSGRRDRREDRYDDRYAPPYEDRRERPDARYGDRYDDRWQDRSPNRSERPEDRHRDPRDEERRDDRSRPRRKRAFRLPWQKRDDPMGREEEDWEEQTQKLPQEDLGVELEVPPPAVPPWESDWAEEPLTPPAAPPKVVPDIDIPLDDVPAPHKERAGRSGKKKTEPKQAAQPAAAKETDLKAPEQAPQSYIYPSVDLLTPPSGETARAAHEELEGTMQRLSSVLTSFGIDGHVTGGVQGPSVTRYEVALEQGVRLNKLTNLSDDVALALGVSSVRIAPVPGKISVVGIEVPNKVVTPVPVREVLDSPAFRRHKSSVAFSLGKDIGGNYIVGDCSKLPHMLIAGTTGSGKSVCINSLIVSMLYKSTPEEVRLIMVDPKMVELGVYNGIPHLLIPVVTDPKKAAGALQWAVTEMMKRYRLFSEAGVRDLASYNHWAQRQENTETMPKVVIVIDELADLMLVAAKEVEESICRVAQMGRAAGMHLVIATQRPSADVITGLMKANIPSRIAFAVASSLESRIILDNTGAEKLVGKGDMLWFPLGSGKPLRVQGCFISDEEVAAVVDSVKQNSVADYDNEVMEQIEKHVTESEKKGKVSLGMPGEMPGEEQDELFPAAVEVTLELGQASVSMLQRRLKLGYARAARLVDQMEDKGIVGPFEGSKPRQLLITKEQWAQMQNGGHEPPFDADGSAEEEVPPFDPVFQKYE